MTNLDAEQAAGSNPKNIFLTTSKGFDTITPELNLDEARAAARKILELDCGEQYVEIYFASGEIIERIEQKT